MAHYEKEREQQERQQRKYKLTMLSDRKKYLEEELRDINQQINMIVGTDEGEINER